MTSQLITIDLETNKQENSKKTISPIGKIFIGITGGIAVGLTIISAPFVSPALRKHCLPYVPATNDQIVNVLAALKGRKGLLLDVGSGDGRIVIETAKRQFVSHGVELNAWLVFYSKFLALKNGLFHRTKFYRRDLWMYDVSGYDNIVIFGVEQMMKDLEQKFLRECKKSCHIVACRFPLPNLEPVMTYGHGIDKVWLYIINKSNNNNK